MTEDFCNYCVVRQEHLNHYGSLFGGHLLSIIDEMAFVACVRTYPGRNFLTRAMDKVEFHTPAHLGDVLETSAVIESVGTTSCRVHVSVFISERDEDMRRRTFDGNVVMVCVDDAGAPQVIAKSKKD